MDDTVLGLIIVALIGAFSALGVAILNRVKPNNKNTQSDEALIQMRIDVGIMKDSYSLYRKTLESQLIAAIHESTTPTLDGLLAKIEPETITLDELHQAKELILAIMADLAEKKQIETPRYLSYAQTLPFIEIRILEKSWLNLHQVSELYKKS